MAAAPRTDPIAEAARRIGELAARGVRGPVEFRPLEPGAAPEQVVAVDGSHAVIADTGEVRVVAVRAVADDGRSSLVHEPELFVAAPDEAAELAAGAYRERGFGAPAVGNAEAFASAMCSLAETDALLGAAKSGPDLLLIDGAVRGLPPGPQALADRVVAAAEQHGVPWAAVSKRSSLRVAGRSISGLAADARPGRWIIDAGDGTWVTRLHGAAPHAFRVDADDESTVAALCDLSRDAVYLGYPYPLARVHNAVAITGDHRRALAGQVEDALHARGDHAGWRALQDFHSVLDRNT